MPTKSAASSSKVISDVEREALRETVRERKAQSRRRSGDDRVEGEREVQAKIAELPPPDRAKAKRIHELVTSVAPSLVPRTFYGMPAYAKDGKVICFFQAASKFKVRYSTFGFQPDAKLDDGAMWPVAFAVMELTGDAEARIAELVKKAVSRTSRYRHGVEILDPPIVDEVRLCPHAPDVPAAPRTNECEECGSRFNLRSCAHCGHVGCCESQAGHARAHALGEHHPVIEQMTSNGPGFAWCYDENRYVR